MNRRIKILLCIVFLLLALGVTLYPLISNIVGEKYRSMVRQQFYAQRQEDGSHRFYGANK